MRPRLGLLGSLLVVGATMLAPSPTLAQQQGTATIREGFESTSKQSFAQSFPEGKRSVVERQIDATDTLLTTAHKHALKGADERDEYREALVHQAAAERALDEERFVEAMYLTLHARSLGRGVIRANTTRLPKEYQPDNLELIKRAGGVEAADVEGFLEAAEDDVPALELLFVEDEEA